MKNLNKIIAFSLAEVLITLVVVSFIAWPFIQAAKKATVHYANSMGAYSAMKNLETAAYDMATNPGCPAADTANTPTTNPTHPYCYSATPGTASTYLPWYAHTDPLATPANRGFCDRLVNEELNTVSTSCASTASSGFKTATASFTTSNGMGFFFASNNASSTTNATGVYTIYVDIDGASRRKGIAAETTKGTNTTKGSEDADVATFLVGVDGTVIPDASTAIANDPDYLNASVWYVSGTSNVYVVTGVSFRAAACAASTNPFPSVDATYCSATHGTYASISQNTNCTTASGHSCVFDYNKPQLMGNVGR